MCPGVLSASSAEALRGPGRSASPHASPRTPSCDPPTSPARWPPPAPLFEHRAVVVGRGPRRAARGLRRPGRAASHARADPAPRGGAARRQARLPLHRPGLPAPRHGPRAVPRRYPRLRRRPSTRSARSSTRCLDRPLSDVVFAERGHRPRRELLRPHRATPSPRSSRSRSRSSGCSSRSGLTPDFLAGHSIGEIAAAHVAGVCRLPDAAKLVAARGRLMQALPAGGAMVASRPPRTRSAAAARRPRGPRRARRGQRPHRRRHLRRRGSRRRRSPHHWKEQGRKTKRLRVSHAFHSPLMEPMLEEFARASPQASTYHAPQIPIVSNLTGELARPRASCATPTTGCATSASRCASPTVCAPCAAEGVTRLPRARPGRGPHRDGPGRPAAARHDDA